MLQRSVEPRCEPPHSRQTFVGRRHADLLLLWTVTTQRYHVLAFGRRVGRWRRILRDSELDHIGPPESLLGC